MLLQASLGDTDSDRQLRAMILECQQFDGVVGAHHFSGESGVWCLPVLFSRFINLSCSPWSGLPPNISIQLGLPPQHCRPSPFASRSPDLSFAGSWLGLDGTKAGWIEEEVRT